MRQEKPTIFFDPKELLRKQIAGMTQDEIEIVFREHAAKHGVPEAQLAAEAKRCYLLQIV